MLKMEVYKVKRLLIIFLIIAMVLSSFAGCVSTSVEEEADDEDKDVVSEDEEDEDEEDEEGDGENTDDEDVESDEENTDDEDTASEDDEESTEDEESESEKEDTTETNIGEEESFDTEETEESVESTETEETESETKKETEKETEKEKPTFNVKESTAGLKFELNEDGLSYTLVDVGTAISKSEVVIDGHDGLPVTKIGYSAFDNSVRKNTKLTKVTIGDYVEVIDCYAFSHCSKLTAVVMGDGVKEIRLGAFRYCSALTSIKLGNSVEYIADSAFYKSTKLASITMPTTVRYIEDYAFENTAYYNDSSKWEKNALYIGKYLIKLKSDSSGTVNVKDGTLVIADNALANCKSVSKVVIPNSVVSIGKKAFKNCTNLATFDMGTGVRNIGEEAFVNTKYYNTSSNWANYVLYVGKYLVNAKPAISGSYTVKTGTLAIADSAFASCQNLSTLSLPTGVVTIGEYAFFDCVKLTGITIKSGIKTIKPFAFKNCMKLTSITLPEYSGWKVDGEAVTDTLVNKTDAVMLLGSVYADKTWTK